MTRQLQRSGCCRPALRPQQADQPTEPLEWVHQITSQLRWGFVLRRTRGADQLAHILMLEEHTRAHRHTNAHRARATHAWLMHGARMISRSSASSAASLQQQQQQHRRALPPSRCYIRSVLVTQTIRPGGRGRQQIHGFGDGEQMVLCLYQA